MIGGPLFAIRAGVVGLMASALAESARATIVGAPVPGQIGFLPANSPIQSDIEWFHNAILLPVTIAISVLVLALLGYVVFRFNERANPTPSRITHNGPLEIAWTVIPALILVVIAVPSFRLLSDQLIIPAPESSQYAADHSSTKVASWIFERRAKGFSEAPTDCRSAGSLSRGN